MFLERDLRFHFGAIPLTTRLTSLPEVGKASQRANASSGYKVPLYVMKCRLSLFSDRVHPLPEARWLFDNQEMPPIAL
jgi:hypothetical protein